MFHEGEYPGNLVNVEGHEGYRAPVSACNVTAHGQGCLRWEADVDNFVNMKENQVASGTNPHCCTEVRGTKHQLVSISHRAMGFSRVV